MTEKQQAIIDAIVQAQHVGETPTEREQRLALWYVETNLELLKENIFKPKQG